ncbi:hypothetical protein BSL78_17524 [Apostichopus japonicus]|uniref:Uncharacterized protein n=1 Tax=Stichopus japonicus TaxID=307972 RepID=A0A2G8KCD3_STIJA|nr:hypothetical protein BSL78_17524 [Apostichopus japonicus]
MYLEPQLFLPVKPPFPEVLNCDQHVIYIDFGTVTSRGFEDYENDTCFDFSGPEFAVTIPLLCDSPGGIPMYSLTLAKFYQHDRLDFPKVNIAFKYKAVDELTLSENGVILREGRDELRIRIIESQTDPCEPPPRIMRHEFEEFINEDLQLGAPEPHFEFCDRHQQINNYFCSIVGSIGSEVRKVAPNFCQSVWQSDDQAICKASMEIETISPGFRSFLLQSEKEPLNIIASMAFFGNYTIGLKYPCITK